MRYVVLKPDGRYVGLLNITGVNHSTAYFTSTPDAADAHDFGSRAKAGAWIRQNGGGKVVELTDGGYWPLED
jgi:hypothetical protein